MLLLRFLPCETLRAASCGARRMDDEADDFDRYRKLLGEAVDEPRRLALIDLLIKERARDRLKYHLATLEAMRAPTVANVLGTSTT